MDSLRRPFLVITVICIGLALLVCVGSNLVSSPPPFAERVESALSSALADPKLVAELQDRGLDLPGDARDQLGQTRPSDPPGFAIPNLALINGVLLLVLALTALPMLVGDRATGTVQGIVSIIGGLVGLLTGIVMAIVAFTALVLMVSLLLAAPFGTLAYLALFGSFDTTAAGVLTTLVMILQIVGGVCLVIAQERFLTSKGLVLLFATAILLTFVTSVLHSIVPSILVSITDALGGLVAAIVGAIWSLVLLIGGIVSAVRLLQLGRNAAPAQLQRPSG
jgi:hypothetical protein